MTKIKICGIKTLSDALAAIQAGADLLGFNFYPKSPRYINPDTCRKIASALSQKHPAITLVGVFVNSSVSEVRFVLETTQLHLAQLHGDETPEMLGEIGANAFKALRLAQGALNSFESVHPYCRRPSVDDIRASVPHPLTPSADQPALLLDSSAPGLYGGSGVTADWSAAAQIAKKYPILLAGGLTLENVAEAVRQVRPWGVDVASGVEASPGVKDPEKMKKFVEQVHSKK